MPLRSGYLCGKPDGGPLCEKLERRLEQYYQVPYARVFNSGTSALHAAIEALQLRPQSHIPVSAYTMSATAAAVVHAGHIPFFIDISRKNYCMDFEKLESRRMTIPDKRALVLVHLFGHHVKYIPDTVARQIVHDCAQSPTLKPDPQRSFDMWVYSLNQHKVINCGEGGYVLTYQKDFADTLHLVRNHGEVSSENIIGHNYRMTEMQAEIALQEFLELDSRINKRRQIGASLWPNSTNIDWFIAPSNGVSISGGTRHFGYHKPLYQLPYFSSRPRYLRYNFSEHCPVTEDVEKNIVWYDPAELVQVYDTPSITDYSGIQQPTVAGPVS